MDLKTTLKNANDPGKYRAMNVTLMLAVAGLYANKYRKERTFWNLLPVVRCGLSVVEAAFKPGKGTDIE